MDNPEKLATGTQDQGRRQIKKQTQKNITKSNASLHQNLACIQAPTTARIPFGHMADLELGSDV